jgi:hypothetical protein
MKYVSRDRNEIIGSAQLTSIAGASNQKFTTCGVVKVPSPIPRERSDITWQSDIDSFISALLSLNPITVSIFHKLSLFTFLALGPQRFEIVDSVDNMIDEMSKFLVRLLF